MRLTATYSKLKATRAKLAQRDALLRHDASQVWTVVLQWLYGRRCWCSDVTVYILLHFNF